MRVVIFGANGYIGHYLEQKLRELGHEVFCADNFSKEEQLRKFGFVSAIPYKRNSSYIDITNYIKTKDYIRDKNPDVIFNLAQHPAPTYSMFSVYKAEDTVINNVVGTIKLLWAIKRLNKDIPVIQIGTLGEYGYHKEQKLIRDGETFVEYGKFANTSIYHVSKCCSTLYAKYLSDLWKMKVIDIQQTVVEGAREGVPLYFDYVFGTVINRMICQAITGKLLIYGSGKQTRSFLSIEDSVRALITVMKNAHDVDGYLSINQLDENSILSCRQIVKIILEKADEYNISVDIVKIDNPRREVEDAIPKVEVRQLYEWGFTPIMNVKREIENSFDILWEYRDRIRKFKHIIPPRQIEGWSL